VKGFMDSHRSCLMEEIGKVKVLYIIWVDLMPFVAGEQAARLQRHFIQLFGMLRLR
jgi:hypothetical protein